MQAYFDHTLLNQPGAVVEVMGWDEAFVGVRTEDPEGYAEDVRADVLVRTDLHCAVGIGDTMVRAKLATGFAKAPGPGVYRLTAENWAAVWGMTALLIPTCCAINGQRIEPNPP